MYILAIRAKRKNAVRHIVDRYKTIEECRKMAQNINKKYIVSIYTGNWQLVEVVERG